MQITNEERQRTVQYAKSQLEPKQSSSATDRIEQGITEIRNLVGEVLEIESAGRLSPVLARAHHGLMEQGVVESLATDVIQAVSADHSVDDETLTLLLIDEFLRRLPRVAPPPQCDTIEPTIIALVGPTGVGKTTTIAKIATKYRMHQGRRVVLITADTYRVAAVEQMRQYAELFDARMEIAGTAIQMKETINSLHDFDIVLIDTAGRSAADGERILETAAILEAAQPTETHLVLSAATSLTATQRAAESFAMTRFNRIVVTKLDEAVTIGQIVSTLCSLDIPMSWFTDGQDIASHIEFARATTLVHRLFDRELKD